MYPFELLNQKDMLLAPVRDFNRTLVGFIKSNKQREDLPRLNIGVIYFKNGSISDFLNTWYQRVGKSNKGIPILGVDCDQSVFNNMISENIDKNEKIDIGVLSNIEYNCRMYFIPYLNKIHKENIKIIHQHYLYINDFRKYFYNLPIYRRIVIEIILIFLGKKLKN